MMTRVYIAAGALALTLWALATMLASPPFMSGADFFPLAMHNSWTHEVTFSGGDYHYYMTETVIKQDLPLFKERSYIVSEEYEPLTKRAPRAKSTVGYFRRGGFLHRYPWLDSEGEKIWDTKLGQGSEQIMPSPYRGDAAWQLDQQSRIWSVEVGEGITSSAKAWIDPETVQVPAGTFHNCLRVETLTLSKVLGPQNKIADFRLQFIEWYAPGVGLVKAVSSEGEGTPVKSVTELLSYKLQKK